MRSAYVLTQGICKAERQNCLLCGIPVYTKHQTRPMCQQHMNRQTEDTTGYATDVSVRVNKCQSVTKVQEADLYFCPNPQWHHNAHTHNEVSYLQVWRIYCRPSGSNLKGWCLTVTFTAFPNLPNRSVNVKASCCQNMFLTRRQRIACASKLCIME